MSEQSEAKITAVEKSESSKAVKVKDPRKVELGKRLAKISREAKERKAKQRQMEESKVQSETSKLEKEKGEIMNYLDYRHFIGVLGLVISIGGLYYSYKRDKRESDRREEKVIVNNEKNKNDDEINKRYVNEKIPSRCSIENL